VGGEKIVVDKAESEKRKFAQVFTPVYRNGHTNFTRSYIRQKLKIPAQYYIDRGYLPQTLDNYDVGLCDDPTKPFYNRVVFPIYADDYSCIVGYTARSIFSSCDSCGFYHSKLEKCPDHDNKWKYAKWLNNKDFQRDSYLYNYWFAKEHIKKTSVIFILEEAIDLLHSSSGIFQKAQQQRLL
jgi:hypothetical protein